MKKHCYYPPPIPSNRKFGGFFVFVFLLLAIYFVTVSATIWIIAFGTLAAIFLIFTLFIPNALTPLNKAWMGLGYTLNLVVSPIILGLIYFALIAPIALIGRLVGRDELRLKSLPVSSYWIKREPVGPLPESFKNQY